MKIMLIRPKPDPRTIGLQSVMICEPLECMILMGVLKENGHEVVFVDMILEKRSLVHFLKMHSPQIVGITGYISHIGVMKDLARQTKAFDSSIIVGVGGVHAEVCPEDFLDEHIDYIFPSAHALYQLVGCRKIDGILPFRDLPSHYLKKYYYLFQENCALIKTSVGCPYKCNFCFCKEISPYKAREIDDVIRELIQIPQKEVYIVDDDFLYNRQRLLEFAAAVKKQDIHKHFLCYGRADFIAGNEDVILELRNVGLSAVIVGVEASDQEQLNTYNKKTTISDNENALAILQRHGIECYATVILGVDWTKEDFNKLYNFIKQNKLIFVNLQPLTPMPATPYFEKYKDQLLIPYDQHEKWDMAHLVISPTKLSVRQYYVEIFKLYYKITLNPRSIGIMFKRYGVKSNMKLSLGALKISVQYLKKIMKG
jgi:MoaA/NifB/PqqE/SkfB family radical SAM enzyme